MEVSGHLQNLVALPTREEAVLAPKLVWMWWQTEKFLPVLGVEPWSSSLYS
jgi:hypothetical protein